MGLAAAEAQFHVLAVDDSLIDRKLIERLLKTSSYQGTRFFIGLLSLLFFVFVSYFCVADLHLLVAVTTVDSGSKALEFLGWNESSSDEAFLSPKNQQVAFALSLSLSLLPSLPHIIEPVLQVYLFCGFIAGCGSKSRYYRLLYAWHDRL